MRRKRKIEDDDIAEVDEDSDIPVFIRQRKEGKVKKLDHDEDR